MGKSNDRYPRLHERGARGASTGRRNELLAVGACIAGLGVAGVAVFGMDTAVTPVDRVVLLADLSKTSDQQTLCRDLGRVVTEVLGDHEGDLHLMLAATGERSRGDKLERLGAWQRVHRGMTVSELGGEGGEDQAVVQAVLRTCAELAPRNESPLFDAARGAVDVARSQGDCDREHVHCSVVMRTDLVEERDALLMAAIAGDGTDDRAPRIDNTHVEVTFCGLAERRVGRRGQSVDAAGLMAAWLPEFRHPELVMFEESCAPMVPDSFADSLHESEPGAAGALAKREQR